MAKEGDAKLEAIVKSLRAEEKQVLAEREKIRNIFSERSEAFETVRLELEKLEGKRKKLESENRSRAATSSDLLNLSTVSAYLRRLEDEIAKVRKGYDEKKKVKELASVRLDGANEEIVRLQLEVKRVQSILTSRGAEERYRQRATEDVETEESNHFRKRLK